MRKNIACCVLISLVFCLPVRSQDKEQNEAVTKAIKQLFRGMAAGDSTMVRRVFSRGATMAGVVTDEKNQTVLHLDDRALNKFLDAVGAPHKEVWYEEIWDLAIKRDGDFAQAWCNYAFYLGNNFSHCGVDAFHLYKTKDGWKILHIADTRRKSGCDIPQEIQMKHK